MRKREEKCHRRYFFVIVDQRQNQVLPIPFGQGPSPSIKCRRKHYLLPLNHLYFISLHGLDAGTVKKRSFFYLLTRTGVSPRLCDCESSRYLQYLGTENNNLLRPSKLVP